MDRQERFVNLLQGHRFREFITPGGYNFGYMGRLMNKEFDGRIADLVPAALDHESRNVRRNAILAMGGSLDPDVFGLLVDIFMDPKHPKLHLSQRAMEYFFDNLPLAEFLDEELSERLGQYCLNRLPDPGAPDRGRGVYIRLLGNMKYRPAESALVRYVKNTIDEGETGFIYIALLALSEMDSPYFDELALCEETREALQVGKRDYHWFQLLHKTVDSSERVRDYVRDIVISEDFGRAKGYYFPPGEVIRAALDIGDDECLDMVWGLETEDGELPLKIARFLMPYPRSYIRSPEEEQALLDAVKEWDRLHDRLRDTDPDQLKEGTIRHWLLGPDSPFRPLDPDEKKE